MSKTIEYIICCKRFLKISEVLFNDECTINDSFNDGASRDVFLRRRRLFQGPQKVWNVLPMKKRERERENCLPC